eukprot:s250_g33.t2
MLPAASARHTVRACIPEALALSITLDVAARVFERFGEVLELDMLSCQSSGEVYVTFSEAAAAEELVKHAEDIVKELASSDTISTSAADLARSELLEASGEVPDYISLLAPTPDELPAPFSAPQEPSLETMHFRPERVASGEDPRTSVVVSGLPPTCSSERFLQAMKTCQLNTKLRFFYLPVDDLANAIGYAFMDFEQPVYLLQLQRALREMAGGAGMVFQNAYISYTRIQGRSRLLDHFRGSDIMFCPDANKRPQFFFPDCG